MSEAKILMVDDEPDLAPLIQQHFRKQIKAGLYEFIFAQDGLQALEIIDQRPDIDLVFSDINMPGMDGLTLLDQLSQRSTHLKAVVVSAYGDMHNIRTAMNRGAFDFVTKPVNFDDLEITMTRALENLRLLRGALEARARLIALTQELAVTAHLQQAILPKHFPEGRNFEVYATMKPATEVGGDFYDFFWLDENQLGLVIADVSGKGITSGLFMAVARTYLQAIAPFCYGPGECLAKLNAYLSKDNEVAMFVTAFYAVYNASTGELSYANAGHNPPIWLHNDGRKTILNDVGGIALGALEETNYQERSLSFKAGDSLILYTDGITEAMNTANEEFTFKRLLDGLIPTPHPKELVLNIENIVKEFSGTAPQSDDITCLVLKRN